VVVVELDWLADAAVAACVTGLDSNSWRTSANQLLGRSFSAVENRTSDDFCPRSSEINSVAARLPRPACQKFRKPNWSRGPWTEAACVAGLDSNDCWRRRWRNRLTVVASGVAVGS